MPFGGILHVSLKFIGHLNVLLCSSLFFAVLFFIFTARYYASVVLAMALCPSVCPFVRHKSVFY